MAPATVLGSMGMCGHVNSSDQVKTMTIVPKTAVVNHVQAMWAADACSTLDGTLADNTGRKSASMAVKATMPRYVSGWRLVHTAHSPLYGLVGGFKRTASSVLRPRRIR